MPAAGHVKTGAWDPEEDDLLYYWQSKVGNKWSEVAKHIPGRTGQQCAQRWRHKVNPNIRRDKWTAEEDAKLIELVKTFGVGRWAEIARNCDGRTDQQCMGRWRRHLDPSIRRDCWSAEEDAKLRQLHAQYGTSWSRISKCLKGRTSQQCRARWHQINNGRGKATAASGGGGASAAASGVRQPAAAAGRRGGQSGKRKTSRRRADLSASEDEEEEEDELEDPDEAADGEEEDEQAPEQAAEFAADPAALAAATAAAAAAAAAAARRQCNQGGSSACFEDAAYAAALAAVSASYDYSALALPAPGQQQQLPRWDSGSPAAAGGQGMDDLAYPADQSEADGQQEPAAYEEGEGSDDGDAAAVAAAAAARGAGSSYHGRRVATGGSAVYSRAAGGVADGAPSPRAAWPSHWSPSRLLLSPPQLSRSEQQLMRRGGGGGGRRHAPNAAASDEPNDEETAGAETLLQMAHLLRRESCEFEPPSLRRSDFITASTPPKRHAAGQRPGADEDTPDEFSPSPYKRARSSRSALFRGPDLNAEDQGSHHHHRLATGSLQHKLRCQSDAGARGSALGGAAGRRQQSVLGRRDEQQQQQLGFEGADEEEDDDPAVGLVAARGLGLQAELDAAADENDEDSFMAAAGEDSDDGDERRGSGSGHAAALRRLGGLPGPADLLGFGLAAAGSGGSGGCVAGGQPGLGTLDPPARPSNASSLTGMPACAAEAAFLSPTPVARVPGSSSRSMATPRRPPAQQSLMNMLGSPSFDRMAGYRSPPSAGRTQPSAATLAALQSPQPSCVHEPFWTPFTGLFKDTLFSRGTSATPDLPSAGKVRAGSLFSPAGKRSGSSSKGGSRRQQLSATSQGDDAPHAPDGAGASSRPAAGTAFESEPGPSPACVLVQPLPSVSHRVVRRLDQHEAWGATPHGSPGQPSAAKQASAKLGAGGGSKADALLGIGFSLFSPVKKQRVPLFSESGAITIGPSPAKPEPAADDDPLAIAPLTHHLACSSNGSPMQPDRGASAALLEPLSAYVRSPLGLKAAGRAAGQSWQRPPASRLLSPGLARQQQQQEQAREQEQQPEPMAVSPAEAAQEQQQPQAEEQQQQQQQSSEEPGQAVRQAAPDTPVNMKAVSHSDNTSCSGTPNTPGQQRVGTSLLSAAAAAGGGGAAAAASPTDYVTPQHRLRPSRPLAPLHKDCLIAAATKSLAGSLAAAAASREECGNSQATASTATGSGTNTGEQQACPEPGAGAAAEAAAAGPAAAQAAAKAAAAPQQPPQQQERPGSAPGSADSSKLSRDQMVDSPLQPCQQLQSPSQWHQGMVAMLRNLQQTPLQPKACQVAGVPAATVQATDGAAAGSKACEGGARAGSRALRRLQDELERGCSTAAATQAQQQQRAGGSKLAGAQAQQQQQQFVVCHVSSAGEVQQVPLSAALAATPAGSAAALLGAVSAPMVLPLFSPAAAGHGCGQAGAAAGRPADAAATARGASLMASVSLTPGVLSCTRGEGPLVAVMHTPGSSAASLAASGSAAERAASPLLVAPGRAAGTPAVAWPVQQRPDGGLVVAALGAGDSPAAAGSAGGLMQLTPGALLSAGGGAGAGGPRLVSIQPAAMLLSGVCAGPGLQFALQPSLAGAAELKVAAAPGSSAAAPVGGPAAASAGLDLRCESSHIVRSRLHALIDGV